MRRKEAATHRHDFALGQIGIGAGELNKGRGDFIVGEAKSVRNLKKAGDEVCITVRDAFIVWRTGEAALHDEARKRHVCIRRQALHFGRMRHLNRSKRGKEREGQ